MNIVKRIFCKHNKYIDDMIDVVDVKYSNIGNERICTTTYKLKCKKCGKKYNIKERFTIVSSYSSDDISNIINKSYNDKMTFKSSDVPDSIKKRASHLLEKYDNLYELTISGITDKSLLNFGGDDIENHNRN
jgi:hypothetical protein